MAFENTNVYMIHIVRKLLTRSLCIQFRLVVDCHVITDSEPVSNSKVPLLFGFVILSNVYVLYVNNMVRVCGFNNKTAGKGNHWRIECSTSVTF